MRAVYAKKSHFFSIFKQLAKPCRSPLNTFQIFEHKAFEIRKRNIEYTPATPAAARIATIHHMLKFRLSDIGVHIWSRKNVPNLSKPPIKTTARRRSMTRSSQLLSRTTVPSTLSYVAFLWAGLSGVTGAERRVMTPHLTNSPILGNRKLDILPILMPLKVVVLDIVSSIGRSSLRQRNPLSQNAKAPAIMESATNSQRHPFMPSTKSFHSTSLNEARRRRTAKAMDIIYLTIFFTFIFLIERCKVIQKFKMFSNFARLYYKL